MDWATWVGGHYTTEKFIREARALGVSRRIAPRNAQGMSFGDTVYLFRHGPYTQVIGAFQVSRLSLPQDINQEIVEWLQAQGKIESVNDAPPVQVYRECGSYSESGGATVSPDTTLKEIVDKVIEICKERGEEPFMLLAGPLVKVYNPPVVIQPRPKPIRGFMHMKDEWMQQVNRKAGLRLEDGGDTAEVVGVENYYKRTTVDRPDLNFEPSEN